MKWICKAMTSDTYLAADGGWVPLQSDAKLFTTEEKDELNQTKYKILERFWDNMWIPMGDE
jgi:hypothetical protein